MVNRKVKLVKIEPWSLAKIFAILGLVWGLIYMIIYGFIIAYTSPSEYAAFIIIQIPIFGLIGGLIGGLITAFLYNVVAGWFGGIEMNFK